MKYLKGHEIRQMWLDFFSSKGHEVTPSASLVPHDDPTILWINAGVAPLKKYFDGREKPSNPRLCNAQKSIRTNDIENVGKTARHHTFFEMLGNFSIGDYFREEALTFAYEILFSPEWFDIEKEKIYITYYPEDEATFNKWVSLGVDPSHLIPIKDNFWEIGEGPCGPDTEIFFDRGPKYDPENLGIKMLAEDIENDRYIEIWNIVFSQYNSTAGLKRENYPELPSKNIDTGSGLERLACVFQGTETNYESDLFMPMIDFLEKYSGKSYNDEENKMAFRVIADHTRSVTFAIADGAMLSNEGRGYVLRRILRRAVRYGKKLGISGAFLYKMVDVVVNNMKNFYPYLLEKQALVEKIIKIEEDNFLKTLESGEKRLHDIIENTESDIISGKDAFLLYDTFGFPLELTMEVVEDSGKKVNVEEFNEELAKQKMRARNARNDIQSMNVQNEDFIAFKEEVKFTGYNTLIQNSHVIALFKDGKRVNEANGVVYAVFAETPFYGESGGQIGDQGTVNYLGQNYQVLNTIKLPNGQQTCIVDFNETLISVGDNVELNVDEQKRFDIACNHSATHLLNESLRKVLGSHVVQHGSWVGQESLRFDFNHYQNLTNEEILSIEKLVNEVINQNIEVNVIETSIEEAKKAGAQAVFGEKYGDVVRLVDMSYSKELCGGTHVNNTGDIKKFAVLGVESKGSGIFRIEGTSNEHVFEQVSLQVEKIKQEILNINLKIEELIEKANQEGFKLECKLIELPKLVGSYQDIINYREANETARKVSYDLNKKYETLYREKNSADYKQFENSYINKEDYTVLVTKVEDYAVDVLKDIVDKLAAPLEKAVIFFANVVNNEKIIFICKVKGLNKHAGNLVKEAAIITGGNGGGRPDFAQAGGRDVTKVDAALEKVKELA